MILLSLFAAAALHAQTVRGPIVPEGGFRAAAWAPALSEELPAMFRLEGGPTLRRMTPLIEALRAGGIVSPEQLQALGPSYRRAALDAALARARERAQARFQSLATADVSARKKYELAQDLLFEADAYLAPEHRRFLEGALPGIARRAAEEPRVAAAAPKVEAAIENAASESASWAPPPAGVPGGEREEVETDALRDLRFEAGNDRGDVFWRRFARAQKELAPYGGPSKGFLREIALLKRDNRIAPTRPQRTVRYGVALDPDHAAFIDGHYHWPVRALDRARVAETKARFVALPAALRLEVPPVGGIFRLRSQPVLALGERARRLRDAQDVAEFLRGRLSRAKDLSEKLEEPKVLAEERGAVVRGEAPFPSAAALDSIGEALESGFAEASKQWRLGFGMTLGFPSLLLLMTWVTGTMGVLGWVLVLPPLGAALVGVFWARAAFLARRARRLRDLAAELA